MGGASIEPTGRRIQSQVTPDTGSGPKALRPSRTARIGGDAGDRTLPRPFRGTNGQPLVAGGWPCRHYSTDWASRAAARATLIQATTLAIEAFPQTILPNPLIKELRALAAGAGIRRR